MEITAHLPPRPVVWRDIQARPDLTGNTKRVFLWLYDLQVRLIKKGRFHGLFPFYESMAQSLGLHERTIMRAVARLERAGLLRVQRPHERTDHRRSNLYIIQWPDVDTEAPDTTEPADPSAGASSSPHGDTLSGEAGQAVTPDADYPQPQTATGQAFEPPRENPETRIPQGNENIQQTPPPLAPASEGDAMAEESLVVVPSLSESQEAVLTGISRKVLIRWLTEYGARLDTIVQWVRWGQDPRQQAFDSRPRNLIGWVDSALEERWTERPAWIPEDEVPKPKPKSAVCDYVSIRCACGYEYVVDPKVLETWRCGRCDRPVPQAS